jgi:geranylgeranyl diphosphate synthase type II
MHSFEELAIAFKNKFEVKHFPSEPQSLYESCDYFLSIGGKRIRPVMCLMGNELFDEINPILGMWQQPSSYFTILH